MKSGYASRLKLKIADKIIIFCLDNELENELLFRPLLFIYTRLLKNSYVYSYEKGSRHHYIPVFLLNNFCIPGTGSLYQYTYNKKVEAVSIRRKAACIPNLYSFRDKQTQKQSDFLEKQLFAHALEKYASRVLNKILKNNVQKLTIFECSILSSYFGFQYVRTPKFFALIKEVIEYLYIEKKVPLNEMTAVEFYKKAFFDNYYSITPSELGRFGLKNNLELDGAEGLIIGIAVRIGNELSERIFKKNINWLTADSPAFFYLSDSAVGMYNPTAKRDIGPFLWEFNEETLIFLPISPRLCLYYLSQEIVLSAYQVGDIIANQTKEMVYEYAFADRKEDEIDNIFI